MNSSYHRSFTGQSALDVLREKLRTLREYKGEHPELVKPTLPEGLDTYLERFETGSYKHWVVSNSIREERKTFRKSMKDYNKKMLEAEAKDSPGVAEKLEAIQEIIAKLEEIERSLLEKGAKTFEELHPEYRQTPSGNPLVYTSNQLPTTVSEKKAPYEYVFSFQKANDVTKARRDAYIEL